MCEVELVDPMIDFVSLSLSRSLGVAAEQAKTQWDRFRSPSRANPPR